MKEKIKKLEEEKVVDFECFSMKKRDELYGVRSGEYSKEFVSLDEIEDMAYTLLKVVEEIRNKDKFSIRDLYYFVREDGAIEDDIYTGHAVDFCRMISGNIFRTKEEAKERAVEILATFEEARKKYVRS